MREIEAMALREAKTYREAGVHGIMLENMLEKSVPVVCVVIGEGGSGISSGQRRRIGVARALIKNAEVLILDEPTAGLDAASEATVLAAVRDFARSRNRAVLLVAHRPAALAIADCVVSINARSAAPA